MTSEADLRMLVEAECEGVLQSVLAARQDLREWLDGDSGRGSVVAAEDTLRGCVAVLQTVLRASRATGASGDLGGRARGIVELLAGPYSLVLPDGDVLYVNRAAAELLGRDREELNRVPFDDRPWGDREGVRRHMEQVVRDGHAVDVVGLRIGPTGEGPERRVVLRSQRLDEEVRGMPLLLVTFDAC